MCVCVLQLEFEASGTQRVMFRTDMWTLQEHIGRVVNAGPREAVAALDEDEDDDREGAGRQQALQGVAEGCAIPLSFLSPLNQRGAGCDLCKVILFKQSQHRSLVLLPVYIKPFLLPVGTSRAESAAQRRSAAARLRAGAR